MNLTDVRRLLLEYGFNDLKELGFKKKSGSLKKSEKEFELYIGFGVAKYLLSFLAEFSFGISSYSVNKIYQTIYPEREYKNEKYTSVFHLRQAVLYDLGKYRMLEHEIKSEKDIKEMITKLTEYYIGQEYLFLTKFDSLKKISGFVNYDDFVKEHSPYLANTLKTGLILSKLTGDPYYNKLKDEYRVLLDEWVEHEKIELEKVISFLDDHTQEELKKIAEG